MSNIRDFQNTWTSYRKRVAAAVEKRDKELARLEKYEGKRAEEEREAARDKFDEAVSVAREEARARFGQAIEAMKSKAEAVGQVMEPPSEEALRTLQMLSLRQSISPTEAEAAAKALQGNDAAIATLREICAARGGAKVAGVTMTKRGQAVAAVNEFKSAANMLMSWQGGERHALMLERNAQRWQGVPEAERVPMSAAIVADIDGNGSTPEFVGQVVGDAASLDCVMLVD